MGPQAKGVCSDECHWNWECRNNWMFIVSWCQQSTSEQLQWSQFFISETVDAIVSATVFLDIYNASWFSGCPADKRQIPVSGLFFLYFSPVQNEDFFLSNREHFHSIYFLSCGTHCIHSTLKYSDAYSCMTAGISPCPSAKRCLSSWFTHRHELYLCQASTSNIPRWQDVFYNLDL